MQRLKKKTFSTILTQGRLVPTGIRQIDAATQPEHADFYSSLKDRDWTTVDSYIFIVENFSQMEIGGSSAEFVKNEDGSIDFKIESPDRFNQENSLFWAGYIPDKIE